jgi:8-oxo-dGTP pyrophosphatase MutT (NUDIX family)
MPPVPASTVIVLRDGLHGPEVLMVRRREGAAFGGAHVFPGGRVDAADCGAADEAWCSGVDLAVRHIAGAQPAEAVGFHVAAARELFEETGMLLARDPSGCFKRLDDGANADRFAQYRRAVHGGTLSLREVVEREGLRLALDALIHHAHWVTPASEARRFDTRFFATRAVPGQTPVHDAAETTTSLWIAPGNALESALRREMALAPPTWTTLRELERFRSVEDALAWSRSRRVRRREPTIVSEGGSQLLVIPGDPLHPDPDVDFRIRETRFRWQDDRWIAIALSE